ncbi:MAG: peptidoglycan-associated lipoprotein Pal [Neomegalonema sp.]|nr:peptidoglycan-associated lipoprotein Pal [Neomegalonema sp.]
MMTINALLRGAAASAVLFGMVGCTSQPDIAPDATGKPAAPAGASDPSSPEYFRVTVGDTIYFTTDSVDLTDSARAVLDQQAVWLAANPKVKVRLEGHADERGTREYNIALGARRAQTVSTYLISKGVDVTRITVVSFGRERPLTACPREDCWAQNRRVRTAPQ